MSLFHFSEDPAIARFEPRPVRVPSKRAAGMDWLNGPLVWAIDAAHAHLYLYPRDCPRIVIRPTEDTTPADRARWFDSDADILAYVEEAWLTRIAAATLYRYRLPAEGFESLDDAGMFVARAGVTPLGVDKIGPLMDALAAEGVELRALPSLLPLKDVWQSSLQASGIRLRNAAGWTAALSAGWDRAAAG